MRLAVGTAVALATLLASLAGSAGAPAAAPERPNVLLLFSDDQRADAVAAHGNSYVDTPNLDRLVRRGFSFRESHVMGSHHGAVCAPSRAMLMSGLQLFRVYDDLDGVSTLPELMGQAGYATFGTGKWHQSQASFARSFQQGRRVFFGGMSDHRQVPLRDLLPDGSFSEVEPGGFSTSVFAEAAIDFIDTRAAAHATSGQAQPFLAYVAFTAPHDPRTPPAEVLERYPAGSVPLPPDYRAVHPFHNGWMTGRDEQLAAWPRQPEVIRAQLAEYYGLITHMDTEIGRILEALRRGGLEEKTLVVFASDNGLALGSHGLLGKQSLYEHSTRVPTVVAGPGVPHGESHALVYLFDLFSTILAGAGLEIPDGVDGRDLAPLWEGREQQVRSTLFTAYEDMQRAVRDGRWKLIRYPRLDHTQLFDLHRDPLELHNRAGDPEQRERVERMLVLLEERQREAGDTLPLTADELDPMEFDYEAIERVPDRHQPEDVRRKYFPS